MPSRIRSAAANRNAVVTFSPGLAASATLGKRFVESQPQSGWADFDSPRKWRNRFAVENRARVLGTKKG